jgi:LCP family protein required for cell wall assembly
MEKMLRRFILPLLILSLFYGCNGAGVPTPASVEFHPFVTESPTSSPVPVAQLVIVTEDPNATTTPTPFQPARPTATFTRTPTPTKTLRPTKTPANAHSSSEINPTFKGGDMTPPNGQVKILVLGSDARPGGGFRTDVIMVIAINPNGTGSVVSFPRDLWVNIPGFGQQRINTAFEFMGIEGVYATLDSNFGVRPDHYVMTNFKGFTDIIDSLGGINIYASQSVTDKCDVPGGSNGYCTVNPGVTQMDGPTALWYVRSRYSTSDFDRTRRAQEVLQGVLFRLLSFNTVTHAKSIYNALIDNVQSDMNLGDLLPLIPLAPNLVKTENVRRYTLGPGLVYDYVIPGSGAMVLLPNVPACRQIVKEALAP